MNKKKMIVISIIGVVLLIGVSFASWIITLTQSDSNAIGSKCFNLTLSETNPINLTDAYPITDEEGALLTPFDFTITNTCNSYASYQVNLEILNNTTLAASEVKVMLDNGTPFLLSSKTSATTTLSNATSAYALTTGYLDPNESVTYHLRLWIKEESTMEASANKVFSSKITIAAGYKDNVTEMERCEATYGEGATICNIIGQADPNNDKCLQVDENGMILNPDSTMSDEETPIICTMEDDYGTSYYLRGNHQDNNVKFANMCWELIRITGTGGYKLIYNGDLDANGKCTTTSGNHTGFQGQILDLSGNKVYGSSYTKEGTTYTLTDTSTMNWTNDSVSIIGKYTCGNTSTSCTTLYVMTGEFSSSEGYALKLDQSTNYAQIGTSAFNYYKTPSNRGESVSPALVGYMYNDTYPDNYRSLNGFTDNYYYGESFTYNNGTYTLTNTVQFADMSDSTNRTLLNTHHYTCFNATDATCTKMYFISFINGIDLYYIKLNGNETISDALNKMVGNNDINVINSHIKGTIDWWYEQNIKNTGYESKLEDTIFCNDRTIDALGSWSETGSLNSNLYFNGGKNKYYLKCPNKRDAFTVSDSTKGNSSLTYPVGLLTEAEHSLTGNYTAKKTGVFYWSFSPNYSGSDYVYGRGVGSNGRWQTNDRVNYSDGVRPSISLKPGTNFKVGGDGTASNPYEVDMNS